MKTSNALRCQLIFFLCVMACIANAQNSVPTHLVDGNYITEWLILGPFKGEDLEIDLLAGSGGEAEANPKEGDTVTTKDGETLTWKRYQSPLNYVDFVQAFGTSGDVTAYAFSLIRADNAGKVLFSIGQDDDMAVFLNGVQVYFARGWTRNRLDVKQFDANSNAGENRCLIKLRDIKLRDNDMAWNFSIRILPPGRTEISGTISDMHGNSVSDATVGIQQKGKKIIERKTDTKGKYRLILFPVSGKYDLVSEKEELGKWVLDLPLHQGERLTQNLTLKPAIRITGRLLMLDEITPHRGVLVEAFRPPSADADQTVVVATTLSDKTGKYQFINLKPGGYQVRCETLDGYVSYQKGEILSIEEGKTLKNINFYFAAFKKGRWQTYDMIDGLPALYIASIYQDRKGDLWFGSSRGVSRFDDESFHTYSKKNGLSEYTVFDITEDSDGNLWFSTYEGVTQFDGVDSQTYTTKDGLAHNLVLTTLQDKAGVFWFATFKGVSRFDGSTFETMTLGDQERNAVLAIFEDASGVLWFGTTAGVIRYDGERWQNFTSADGLVSNQISTIFQDRDGVLWFGMKSFLLGIPGKGISRFDGKTFQNLTTEDGLAHNSVNAICQDEDGHLWFATGGGVSEYDGVRFRNHTVGDGLGDNRVLSAFSDREGVLWFGTQGSGVSRYNRDFQVFTTADGLPENSITALFESKDGSLWIGTRYGGVCRYDGVGFETLTTKDGLLDNTVRAVAEDLQGNLWFGTEKGVSRFDGTDFQTFTTKDNLAGNSVNAVAVDRRGHLWFVTSEGVSKFDGETFNLPWPFPLLGHSIRFHPDESGGYRVTVGQNTNLIQTGEPLSLTDDDNKEVKFEGRSDGVRPRRQQGGFRFPFFGKTYTSVFVNSNGNLTFGEGDNFGSLSGFREGPPRIAALLSDLDPSAGGRILVSKSEAQVTILYDAIPGFQSNFNNTFQIRLYHDGTIELAFSDEVWYKGIVGISPGKTTEHREIDYLADLPATALAGAIAQKFGFAWVNDIHPDAEGNLWLASREGIYKYDGNVLTHLTKEDGLIHNQVHSICEDTKKRLWFGTERGVSVYEDGKFRTILDEKAIWDILQDRKGVFWFATYGKGVIKYDGVNFQRITTHNGLSDNTVGMLIEDRQWNLWFGGRKGLTKYTLPKKRTLPLVRITQIIADDIYKDRRSISFPSTTKQITIEYFGMSFKTRFEDLKYTSKLEGFDPDWSLGTTSRRVSYKNLKPGTYRFLVKAIDRDLNYSEPAHVTLKVVPPWYLNGWIAIPSGGGILALFGSVIFFGVRYYTQRRQMRQQERVARAALEAKNQQIQELNEQLTDENLRITAELDITKRIQRLILPTPDELKAIAELDIDGYMDPAHEVGGDYYDVLQRGGTIAISIGDVTGHGLESGLVMLMTQTAVQALLQSGETDPVHLLDTLNRTIYNNVQRIKTDKNLTLCLLDYQSGELKLSGQHEEMIVVRKDGQVELVDTIDLGFPIGLDDNIADFIDQTTVQLHPGDGVVLYTDGITEAENTDGEQYGLERLCEVISQYWAQSAEAIKEAVIADVRQHIGEQEVYDDITLVVMKQK